MGNGEIQLGSDEHCGGELAIADMDQYERWNIGRRTYRFVRQCMRNPELRDKIKARAAEIREEEARAAAAAQ